MQTHVNTAIRTYACTARPRYMRDNRFVSLGGSQMSSSTIGPGGPYYGGPHHMSSDGGSGFGPGVPGASSMMGGIADPYGMSTMSAHGHAMSQSHPQLEPM